MAGFCWRPDRPPGQPFAPKFSLKDFTLIRTHTCGQLRAEHVGQTVTLCGWVDKNRDHKGVLFVDLRDRYGKTQIVFGNKTSEANMDVAKQLRSEYVIAVTGVVAHRPEGTVNPKLDTGAIELECQKVEVLNRSTTPPFQPGSEELPSEEIRLKYRFLDLRRAEMQRILILRHRIIKAMRDFFDEHGFLDVETPMLGRSTPEGARDYLVPSRVSHGSFYALPQSPQLYKQILMVAGYDRYVQVARCFRDEDLRADRQPEFTQLDVEMSFVDAEDVIGIIDQLVERLAKNVLGLEVKVPLARMTYDEAMERFGHDAPDLRYGMELIDLTDIAREVEFRVFRGTADGGGRVRGINAKGAAAKYSRKDIDELTAQVIQNSGAKGLAWFKVEEGRKLASPIAKNFTEEQLTQDRRPACDSAAGRLLAVCRRQIRSYLQSAALAAEAIWRGVETLRSEVDALLVDRRVSDVRLRRRNETLGRDAPSVHRMPAARHRNARDRSGPLPSTSLRPGDQRLRSGRRHDPDSRSADAAASVRAVGNRCSDGSRTIRLPTRCFALSVRRMAESRWGSTAG